MKILFINSLYSPHVGGGAEITLQNLVEQIKREGHTVAVMATGPHKGMQEEEVNGIKVYRVGLRNIYFHFNTRRPSAWKRVIWHLLDIYNPFMKKYVQNVINKERPDVVSCHNMAGWSISAWDVIRTNSIPIVQVLHDYYIITPRLTQPESPQTSRYSHLPFRAMRIVHRRKSRRVTAVVGVSEYILKKVVESEYFKGVSIKTYIHNTRKFACQAKSIPDSRDDKIIFGFIGTLALHKGIELLLETFVKHAQPNWRLKIAGAGKAVYENGLKVRFSHPGIEFVGHANPADFYPTLDITVVPSLWEEPLGMVVAESLLFGIPVLASNRGGIPEMIRDKKMGMLFDPQNPLSLLLGMTVMANERDNYRSQREEIRQCAAPFGNQHEWARKWLAIYTEAIETVHG